MDHSLIDQDIIQAQKDIIRKEKIVIHLEHLRQSIKEEESDLEILKRTLEKEEKDIRDIDKINIQNFFYRALGAKEDRLEKERQEYLLALWQYNDASKSLDRLIAEEKLFLDILYKLFDAEKRLDELIIQKRSTFPKKENGSYQKIFDNEQSIIRLQSKIEEIKEAQEAASKILPLLDSITNNLQDIKKKGPLDYNGKDRYSSYKKKKYIKDSENQIPKVKLLLQQFEKELHDVSEHYQFDFKKELKEFKNFIKIFLRHSIKEGSIKKKVTQSQLAITNIMNDIKNVLQTLGEETLKTQESIFTLQEINKNLILHLTEIDN